MSSGNPNPQNPGQNNGNNNSPPAPHPHQDFLEAVEWSRKYNGNGNNQSKPVTDNKNKQVTAEQIDDNSINWIRLIIAGVIILVVIFLINYFYKKPDPQPNAELPPNFSSGQPTSTTPPPVSQPIPTNPSTVAAQ